MAVLCMKMVIPAGLMPSLSNGTMTMVVCSGTMQRIVTIAVPGKSDFDKGQEKAPQPCAFGNFAAPMLAGADPVLLLVAIAFVMASGLAATTPRTSTGQGQLRPPTRGPPATA